MATSLNTARKEVAQSKNCDTVLMHLPRDFETAFFVTSRVFNLGTEWVVANQELCERQGFVVRNLPVGEKINFRVVAVNIAGRSPPATMAQPVTIREIMGESHSELARLKCYRKHSALTLFSEALISHLHH